MNARRTTDTTTTDGRRRRISPAIDQSARNVLIGAILVLVGGIMWGSNATVSKILMEHYGAQPMWIACIRELCAGLLFLAVAGMRSPHQLAGAVRERRSWPWFVLCAVGCVLAGQVSYLSSIDWTNAGTATVLQTLNLLVVLLYVCIHDRRLPGRRESAGVALAFVGTVLIATGGDLTTLKLPLMGLFWGLINATATGFLSILPAKLIAKWGNMTVSGLMFLISGVILLPIVRPWSGAPAFDAFGFALMTYTVVFGTFGAYGLFMAGVMRVGAMRATMLGTSEPIAATVTAVLFTGAVFAPTDLVGFAMIIVMVFLVH